MFIRNPWPAEFARVALLAGSALILGLLTNHLVLCVLVAAAFYLGAHIRNLIRLERWLRHGRQLRPPESGGFWGTVFDNLYRLQRRHRQRRRRLSELLREFRETANAMPDATIALRAANEIVWWNRLAAQYFGLRWPQDQGQRLANLLRHPQFTEFVHRGDWHDALTVPSPAAAGRILEVRIVPYGFDQKLLLAREVTQLHRLETMRRDFVANITHELRTPLTVIQGVAETLGDVERDEADDVDRGLSLIGQQTRRMGRLIDDLLLLSRLETAERTHSHEEVDVARLVDELLDEAHTLSDREHHFTAEVDRELAVHGDEGELRSAFSNLLVNAVKYTAVGGAIHVRWFEAAGTACLSVADTGVGIPAHHLPRVTERFYRVDSGRSAAEGGTGLGLAIVKHVLARHGARLEVTSRVEKGSTFVCVFSDCHRLDPPPLVEKDGP